MANWIHCNKCARTYNEKIPFYVGACGHLECKNCIKPDSNQNCCICLKPCKRILLSKDMQPDILMFFKPIGPVLDQAKKVLEFQEKQRTNLISLLQLKYGHAKKENFKSQSIIESQRNDINKLRNLFKTFQTPSDRKLQPPSSSGRGNHSTSTPMSSTPQVLDCTMSTIPSSLKPGYAKRMPAGVMGKNHIFMTPKSPTPPAQRVPASTSSITSSRFSGNRSVGLFSPMNFPYIHRFRQN